MTKKTSSRFAAVMAIGLAMALVSTTALAQTNTTNGSGPVYSADQSSGTTGANSTSGSISDLNTTNSALGTGDLGTSVDASATATTGTPGLPNTGAGGNAAQNLTIGLIALALLIGSVVALRGSRYA